jgi:hypothetical protein
MKNNGHSLISKNKFDNYKIEEKANDLKKLSAHYIQIMNTMIPLPSLNRYMYNNFILV